MCAVGSSTYAFAIELARLNLLLPFIFILRPWSHDESASSRAKTPAAHGEVNPQKRGSRTVHRLAAQISQREMAERPNY